ncbi:MAG: 2-keto-4-pentenoate hydratase [Pseudolabrys sp.]|jgi:2-keto-4-pentenoate hydratase|nr:2-keto-4-pentenoate hydratase [Pseudolabrys sp.]
MSKNAFAQAAALADALNAAETARAPIAPISRAHPAATELDAYAVQAFNIERGLKSGRRIVGRKIGLTSVSVQAQFGVNQPDCGILFADMEVPDRTEVPAGELIAPRVEAEIGFVIGKSIEHPDVTVAELVSSIAYAMPAIEIVDSRIVDWKINLFDTIADNASSARFVLGSTFHKLCGLDLRLCGMMLEKNGEPVSFGAGAACMGHPLNAVRWLARVMAQEGRPLRAGDVVLSGALGPMVPAAPGDRFTIRIEKLGDAAVSFQAKT